MTDWRTHLSDPPKPHSLRDLVLLILDMAEADADALGTQEPGMSARHEFEVRVGYDIYDFTREIMEAFPALPKFDHPEASDDRTG